MCLFSYNCRNSTGELALKSMYFRFKPNIYNQTSISVKVAEICLSKSISVVSCRKLPFSCTYSSPSSLRAVINCNSWGGFKEGISSWSMTPSSPTLARISVIAVQFDVSLPNFHFPPCSICSRYSGSDLSLPYIFLADNTL